MKTPSKHIDYDLLAKIERYLASTGISVTKFGRSAANDSMLVTDIREGRELRRKTRQKIEALLANQPPQKRDQQ